LLADSGVQTDFGSFGGQPKIYEWDSTQYEIGAMTSWEVFGMTRGAAFDNTSILTSMGFTVCVSLGVACLIYQSKEALFVQPDKIERLATFLNVFVGILLGFFLSSSMHRWHGCTSGFLALLDAVRGMQMQMIALGVDRERIETLNRYGVLSVWLLHLSLNIDNLDKKTRKNLVRSPRTTETEKLKTMWTRLEQSRPYLVRTQEKALLLEFKECYALLWTWVASLIGRMAQDGEIPPMASPTYGRIINIVEMAYGSIRDVRMMQRIKAPFCYVHTLAILVHVNNILNGISFGLVLGMTAQVVVGKGKSPFKNGLPMMVTSLFMQFCISMVAPFLYLALLEVCVCISQPFSSQDTKIPAVSSILQLEDDLVNAGVMGENTKWNKPSFKK